MPTMPNVTLAVPAAAPKPRGRRFLALLGLLIAAGLGWGAWTMVQDHNRLQASGVAVEGSMTGGYRQVQTTRRGSVVSTSYYPTFSYRTPQGQLAIGTVQDEVELGQIERGRRMALVYDPQDSNSLRLASALAGGPGAAPWVLGGLALLLGLASLVGLVRRRAA